MTIVLEELARLAAENTYSPYSKFPVGCAIEMEDGLMFSGCNVENASYGLTMCAERVAIGTGIAEGGKAVKSVVIYTPTQEPVSPCGACRQVIAEFADPTCVVESICDGEERIRWTVAELLPAGFNLKSLGQV